MNGKRILNNITKREEATSENKISRNMQYSKGSWNDSHRN